MGSFAANLTFIGFIIITVRFLTVDDDPTTMTVIDSIGFILFFVGIMMLATSMKVVT